jgi:SAM-dependent methyltransferase
MLGPLYHLTVRDNRLTALQKAGRVLRPGGLVFAAAISRFASTFDGLRAGFLADPEFEQIVERDIASGLHTNPRGRSGWFTTAYFHRPDEFAAELVPRQATFALSFNGTSATRLATAPVRFWGACPGTPRPAASAPRAV